MKSLKSFHAKHKGTRQFSNEDLVKAEKILEDCFSKLDRTLEGRSWIMGEQFTLADISWVPLYHVLIGCGYPFEKYENIARWAAAFLEKESFKEGVLKWCADFSKV